MPIPYLNIAPCKPALPNRQIEEMQKWVGARQSKGGKLIKRRLGIADSFHVGEMVVVEVRFRPIRRAEVHKDRPHSLRLNLRPKLRNVVQSLRAKGACKVAKKDEQNRRFIHQFEQRAPCFR